MHKRRLALPALSLLLLTACSAGPSAIPAPPGAAPDARAMITASTAGLAAGNYRYTSKRPTATIEGIVDLPDESLTEITTYAGEQPGERRLIKHDDFNRNTLTHQKWQHIDVDRVPERFRAGQLLTAATADRTSATAVLATVQSATASGSTVTGKVDLYQARGFGPVLDDLRTQLTLPSPYTATLDDQGRLTRLVLPLKDGAWTLEITYGTAVAPQPPAKFSDQPDSFYAALH